ncbi:MAG: uridylate kinase [Methylococcales bacterium]
MESTRGSSKHDMLSLNSRLWVVKLGGSLANTPYLVNWLDVLARPQKVDIVVVPGGGKFADQVRSSQRKWKFDENTAHRMALLAMQQSGLMLASLSGTCTTARNVDEIRMLSESRPVTVWLPDRDELERAKIPSGWDITSDSLACWLAAEIAADRLVIVKSSPRSGLLAHPEQLAEQGVMDRAFPEFWKKSGVALRIFHGSEYKSFARSMDRAHVWDAALRFPDDAE